MKLSVIVPVRDGSTVLPRCLDALAASTRPPDELIVVDDRSTDDTAEIARGRGARVLVHDGPALGPAAARNRGVAAASGDVLVFIDSDVVVHPDSLARIERYFDETPELDALFGSYDDAPPDPSPVSKYKNLLHHFTHQRSRREASTFWAGCGAVRHEAFLAVGGFDASYGRPCIEDIELGVRLRAAGRRVWSCPDVLCTHLKRWTLAGMVRTDVLHRALPWSQLIARRGEMPDDLNLDRRSRLSAAAACSLVASTALAAVDPLVLALAPAAAAAVAALNAPMLRLMARCGGARLVAAALALHILYLIYSSLTFAAVLVAHRLAAAWPGEAPALEPAPASEGSA